MTYPRYSKPERIADAAVHIAGIVFAVVGTCVLLIWAARSTDTGMFWGLSIYTAMLIGSFVASACYHFTPWEGPRPTLRRIDHAAIYLKIAGTSTPLVVLIGSAFAYGILVLGWALAMIGVVAKLFFWKQLGVSGGRWGTALYLGLGWVSVALLTSLAPLLSGWALALIAIGGLTYSLGAVLFCLEGLRFQNAIWHGFVLAASVCFFAAISMGVLAAI